MSDFQMTTIHAEVLHHHFTHGKVWDGDQISKQHRDDLIRAGYLTRCGEGLAFCKCTSSGWRVAANIQRRAGNV